MDLSGKSAIVLGGTSGIGLSAVQQLERAGATVVAGSRSRAHIEQAASSTGATVTYQEIDVLDRDRLSAIFEAAAPFDILVNCATGGERASGPFLEMDLDGFQGSFRKLWGYVNSVRLGAEHMAAEGAIVLVSGDGRQCGRRIRSCDRPRNRPAAHQRCCTRVNRYPHVPDAGRGT